MLKRESFFPHFLVISYCEVFGCVLLLKCRNTESVIQKNAQLSSGYFLQGSTKFKPLRVSEKTRLKKTST